MRMRSAGTLVFGSSKFDTPATFVVVQSHLASNAIVSPNQPPLNFREGYADYHAG
jgi:hypothetical protein